MGSELSTRDSQEPGAVFAFFISTPYIDAYQHDWDDPDKSYHTPKENYAGFVKRMESQAFSWGEQGVGRAALSGRAPAMRAGRHVLAFGTLGDKKYVALPKEDGRWGVDVVEVDEIPDAWDVT